MINTMIRWRIIACALLDTYALAFTACSSPGGGSPVPGSSQSASRSLIGTNQSGAAGLHRTNHFVVIYQENWSPFARRHFVDHTQYETLSILRTIELRYGLQPLTQRDASALPLLNAFDFSS